jgi:hypothetical protein
MALPVLVKGSRRTIPITVKTRRVRLDESLRQVVYAHVRRALGRFCGRVREVFVWIEDANGPREGSGIQCRLAVVLTRGAQLSATAEASNEYAAVAACAIRARTMLDRLVKKRRRTRRSTRPVLGGA